jgi:hypothetical protein
LEELISPAKVPPVPTLQQKKSKFKSADVNISWHP